jgi:hypothetical protein
MEERLARFISGLTSPFVVLSGFGLWVTALLTVGTADFLKWGMLFFIFIVGIPLFFIVLNMRLGTIADLHVTNREERRLPFLLAILSSLCLTAVYVLLDAPSKLIGLSVTFVVCGLVFGLITMFWKISMHAAAYTGSVFIAAWIIDFRYLWLLLLLPLVVWARYVRGKHSIPQSLAATLLVVLCIGASLSFFL